MRGLQLFKLKREVIKARHRADSLSYHWCWEGESLYIEACVDLEIAIAVLDHYQHPEKWEGRFELDNGIEEELPF